ncbi:hypothetical protein BC938DRAFT_482231 [Jimgerdemannia flammicorona]|uniref:Uncharacterized protein n=1 Tax=Jimgerdemannia flammicorona TaxID=994334 RepID=A0A433QEE7_9FUNG|nr:hypothetical protein BC938DRAFT_482231 [Jimgerdemannia flammicorona]
MATDGGSIRDYIEWNDLVRKHHSVPYYISLVTTHPSAVLTLFSPLFTSLRYVQRLILTNTHFSNLVNPSSTLLPYGSFRILDIHITPPLKPTPPRHPST